eukprot:g4254.t1
MNTLVRVASRRIGHSRVACGRHAIQTRNSGGMGVKKDFRIEEQDGLRSDVFKVYNPFKLGTFVKTAVWGLIVPVGLFFAITSHQKSQDASWYPKRDAKYL